MFFSSFCLFQGSPRYLGEPQSRVIKILMGAVMLIALVLLIWGPLLVISLINTTNEPNPPVAVNIKLTIAGYQVYSACTSLVNSHAIWNKLAQLIITLQYQYLQEPVLCISHHLRLRDTVCSLIFMVNITFLFFAQDPGMHAFNFTAKKVT